jgi:hypothetical protein
MDTDLDEARRFVENIRSHLPSSVDIAALGVKSKTPYHLLAAREALIWRTEELARGACEMLAKGDLAVGILLTRAVTESAAFVWRLKELLETRSQYSPAELHQHCERLFLGWKKKGEPEFPEAINIMTLIDRMDQKISGVRSGYDQLSEFAHPNWSGVSGLFSLTDKKKYITHFGRGLRNTKHVKEMACSVLVGSLELFQYAYNVISDKMPAYLAELEPF